MAYFWWIINGEEIMIYFSLCKNGSWVSWDYALYEHSCCVGIEFTYLGDRITLKPSDLNSLDVYTVSMLIRALNLPYELPPALELYPIEGSFKCKLPGKPLKIVFSRCQDGQWAELDKQTRAEAEDEEEIAFYETTKCTFELLKPKRGRPNPNFKFNKRQKKSYEFEDDGDDPYCYSYVFHKGMKFTYLDHNVFMKPEDLESLHAAPASMLLQVLNLDAT